MSAKLINLRSARKAKARDAKAKHAGENRAKFGRPKSEQDRTAAERQHVAKKIDHARLVRPGEDESDAGSEA